MNIVTIIYLAVILAGGLFIFLAINQKLKAQKAEKTWPTVPGVVLDSEIKIHRRTSSRGGSSRTYQPYVTYEYRVKDQAYVSDQLGFGNATYGSGKAHDILALYPQGAPVTVHYDPTDPSKAVLETKAVGFWIYLILGIIILAAGIVAAWVL